MVKTSNEGLCCIQPCFCGRERFKDAPYAATVYCCRRQASLCFHKKIWRPSRTVPSHRFDIAGPPMNTSECRVVSLKGSCAVPAIPLLRDLYIVVVRSRALVVYTVHFHATNSITLKQTVRHARILAGWSNPALALNMSQTPSSCFIL